MIVFQNEGLIDLKALKTFGVSAKVSSHAIGFFGTGLKYAIAILLREGHRVTLFRGKTKYTFVAAKSKIRSLDFDIVQMHQGKKVEDLAFTTDLGKTWEIWQAFRELYCNTKDEFGQTYESFKQVFGEAGKTKIIVEGAAFKDSFHERHKILIEDRKPIAFNDMCDLFEGASPYAYFRGIRAGSVGMLPASFTWNFTAHLELSEDRTLKHAFMVEHYAREFVVRCENSALIERLLTTGDHTFEHDLNYAAYDGNVTDEFLAVVETLQYDYSGRVNRTAIALFDSLRIKSGEGPPTETSTVQDEQMRRAVEFCEALGYSISKYEIVVRQTLGSGVLGLAKDGKIFIAKETFELGTKMLAGTLLEEWIHLETGFDDMTRVLQNYLINRIITMGETAMGKPL